jgi:hypothetical protein
MAPQSSAQVRHSVRPLNTFSFCGEHIAQSRQEYHLLTKDLPQCPECQRVRDQAVLTLGRKRRRLA